jgi:hypothetical protein
MTARAALRAAARDLYQFSWRLLVVNTMVTGVICAVVLFVSAFPLVLFIAPLVAGPFVAALVYCVVLLIREDTFVLADAMVGLRRHWRTGFALGGLFGAALLLGALSVIFYSAEEHRTIPLAALSLYVVAIICLLLLVAWPFAIAAPEHGLGAALRRAWTLALHAPLRLLALGLVLLVVNVAGAITVLPLLTLTIAYSFLATAHLVLSAPILEEVST